MKALILILCAGSMLAINCHADFENLPPFPPALLLTTDPPPALSTPAPAPPQVIVVPAPPGYGYGPNLPIPPWAIPVAGVITAATWLAGYALKKVMEMRPQIAELVAWVQELRGRADRSSAKQGQMQAQITTVATIAAPAALPAILQPTDPAAAPMAPPASASGPGSPSVIVPAICALLVFGGLLGCATATGDAAKDRRGRITNAIAKEVFNGVLQVALAEGANALAGQNGQDAAAAAFSAAGRIDGAAAIRRVIAAAAPQLQPVAEAAAQQYAAADPRTAAEKALVVNTIGAAIQIAANQIAR